MSEAFPRARDPDVFPPSVSCFSVAIPADAVAAAGEAGTDELPPALRPATAKRRIQFLAGRFCARRAMERLASVVPAQPLAQDSDGCPVWPAKLVGSIAHTDRFATAAVAAGGKARGLGVDVEPVMSGETAEELARLVASDEETRTVARVAGLSAAEALTLVFSAKESLYKALYPATRLPFDYRDCEIVWLDPGKRRFALRFGAPFHAAFGAAERQGRYELSGSEVRTGVLLTPER